jgi:hypothetical protein
VHDTEDEEFNKDDSFMAWLWLCFDPLTSLFKMARLASLLARSMSGTHTEKKRGTEKDRKFNAFFVVITERGRKKGNRFVEGGREEIKFEGK